MQTFDVSCSSGVVECREMSPMEVAAHELAQSQAHALSREHDAAARARGEHLDALRAIGAAMPVQAGDLAALPAIAARVQAEAVLSSEDRMALDRVVLRFLALLAG